MEVGAELFKGYLARPRNLATRKAVGARRTKVSVKRKKRKGREGRGKLLEETSHQTIVVKKTPHAARNT